MLDFILISILNKKGAMINLAFVYLFWQAWDKCSNSSFKKPTKDADAVPKLQTSILKVRNSNLGRSRAILTQDPYYYINMFQATGHDRSAITHLDSILSNNHLILSDAI
jgi:hypothetical protein